MRFALTIEPQQGLSYGQQLEVAKRAEANGFETFFRTDHYAGFPPGSLVNTTDAWTVLAGLARDTQRIGLGVLVSPVTFRHPGSFAKVVTTVDEMSGGRVEVGVGAGWHEVEHRQFGLPFPSITERADLLEDQLAILHGLWEEPDGWSYDGRSVQIQDAAMHPKPVAVPGRPTGSDGSPRPRIICGGGGSPRGLRLAARYADEQNLSSKDPAGCRETFARLDAACSKIGRDPASITRSAMVGILIGRTDTEVQARLAHLRSIFGHDDLAGDGWLAERRARWIIGTPDAARAAVRAYAEAGVERLMLQDFLPLDLDQVDVMGEVLVGAAV